MAIGGGVPLMNSGGLAVGSVGYNSGAPMDGDYHANVVAASAQTSFVANGGAAAGMFVTTNIDDSMYVPV